MSFDLRKILDDKRRFRRELAERPIEEKLGMLDTLRERELAIRGSAAEPTSPAALHETPPPDRARTK